MRATRGGARPHLHRRPAAASHQCSVPRGAMSFASLPAAVQHKVVDALAVILQALQEYPYAPGAAAWRARVAR